MPASCQELNSHPSARSVPPDSSIEMAGSGTVAGPWTTAPVVAEKIDPWQGQRNCRAGLVKAHCATHMGAHRVEGDEGAGGGTDHVGRDALGRVSELPRSADGHCTRGSDCRPLGRVGRTRLAGCAARCCRRGREGLAAGAGPGVATEHPADRGRDPGGDNRKAAESSRESQPSKGGAAIEGGRREVRRQFGGDPFLGVSP